MKYIKTYVYFFLIILLAGSTAAPVLAQAKKKKDKKESVQSGDLVKARGYFHDAMKEVMLENYDAAEKLFRQCLALDPGNAAANYELGRIYYQREEIPEATALAEKAAELSPDNHWYLLFLGELYDQGGKNKEAIRVYQQLTRKWPRNADFYYLLAGAFMHDDNPSEAIKALDQVEAIQGVNEDLSLQKQKIYLLTRKNDKAEAEIQKLSNAFPGETRYMAMLAEMYMLNGKQDKAWEMYTRILETDPGDPYVRMSLADYYRKKGDKDKSFNELKLGFANSRLDIDTKINILMSYYVITETYDTLKQQAFELAEILVATHPSEAKAYSIRADFLAREMKYAEAREDLLKVISLDSSRYIIWELLLRMDAALNDFRAASGHSSRAIAMFPMQPFPYLMEGLSYSQEKKYEEAIKSLKRGVSLVVDDKELLTNFYMYLGDAYYQAGDAAEAFKAYEKVLQFDPVNAYVLNNYSYYLSLRKENLAKAASMAKKANEISPGNASFEDTYAWVLYQQGYYQEALPWIEKALANDKDPSAEVLEHYGDILFKLGRNNEALDYWIKASEAGEGSKFLQQKIKEKKLYE